jgi:hypothetical protein
MPIATINFSYLSLSGENGRRADTVFLCRLTRRGSRQHRMLHIGSVAIFLAKVCSHNEKPDRYAAAICIRVRPDCLLRGYSGWRKLPPVRAAKGVTDLRRYPDAMRFSSNGYFFFFLAAFFAFFAFFAFLAMLPSVVPKVGSMQVDPRHACIQTTPQLQI